MDLSPGSVIEPLTAAAGEIRSCMNSPVSQIRNSTSTRYNIASEF
jgi:hypothetical protein